MKNLLKEPLLHFLAIGAALFLYYDFSGGGSAGPGSTRIVVTSGQIAHLEAGFVRTWQRPPTEAELKNLLDEWVREEIAVRQAMAAGLDRDDTVVRRRLRQKLEFLLEDAAEAAPPTDAELEAWYEKNAADYRTEPRVAFRQVFISRDRRGASAAADAAALVERLDAAGLAATIDALGDATLLPRELELSPWRDVDRVFGDGFARKLDGVTPGRWAGPLASGYGLHVVFVSERAAGELPDFTAVRPLVERDFLNDRRKRQIAALYDRLLEKYSVVIEPSGPRQPAPTGKGGS